MDWKTFVADVVSAGMWPTVVFTAVLLLREQFKAVLANIAKLLDNRVTDFSLTRDGITLKREAIDDGLRSADVLLAAPVEESVLARPTHVPPRWLDVSALADLSPATAIAAAAAKLESAIRVSAVARGVAIDGMDYPQLVEECGRHGLLTDQQVSAALYLGAIHNEAGRDVATSEQAREYIRLAASLTASVTAPGAQPQAEALEADADP